MYKSNLFKETTFEHCLACGSDQLELLQQLASGESPSCELKPVKRKLKVFRSSRGISLHGDLFHMCRNCGFLFRQDAPGGLKVFLDRYVKD